MAGSAIMQVNHSPTPALSVVSGFCGCLMKCIYTLLVGRADESNKIMYPLVPVPLPALKFITITKFHVLAVWIMTPLMDTYTCISTVLTPCRGGSARISYWAGMESAGAPYSRPRPSSGSSSETSWILHRDQYILLCVII